MPFRYDPRPTFDARMAIHIALTAILLWLAFVLILPGSTFAGSGSWRFFQMVGTEEQWAMMMFAGSVAGAVGIDTYHRWVKVSSILFLATAHGTLALLFLLGNPMGGASGTYAIVAMLGYYLAARQVFWRPH